MFLDFCAHQHLKVENKESESTIICVYRRKLDIIISYILSYYKERKERKRKKGERKKGRKKEEVKKEKKRKRGGGREGRREVEGSKEIKKLEEGRKVGRQSAIPIYL